MRPASSAPSVRSGSFFQRLKEFAVPDSPHCCLHRRRPAAQSDARARRASTSLPTRCARGARAGIVAALGITAGCFVHIVAAAVGVSALMAASATAFTVLKWIGAAYLL